MKKLIAIILCLMPLGLAAQVRITEEDKARDRTFNLPEGQDSLILAASQVNPNVIACINAGAEIDLSVWGDKVASILMKWCS